MNGKNKKKRLTILVVSLSVAALLAVAAFGAIQALSQADAEQIALDQYPGATVLETELDDENGSSAYAVELQADTGEVEVKIDSTTGEILAADADDEHEDEDGTTVDIEDDDGDQIENEQEGDFEHED